jgi:dolichol kinase
MKTKRDILLRKSLHLALILPFALYWYISAQNFTNAELYAKGFLALFVIAFLIYEYLRLDTRLWVPFSSLVKPKEQNTNVDGLNLVLAAIVATALFEPIVSITAILIAIIGDTFSTVGGIYGTMKVFPNTENKTTWEGILLALIVNFVIAGSIWGFGIIPLILALSGVIIETFASKLDDNLAIPLGVGFIGQIIWLILLYYPK